MAELIFLGAGGGRYQTVDQHFKTGGFRIHAGSKVHVDPGPGALLLTHQYGLSPLDLDCVAVTHCHTDHYTDTEVLVEAMSQHLTKKRGTLICSRSVVKGSGKFGPAVSRYHQSKPGNLVVLNPGESYQLDNMKIETVRAKHSDPTSFGILFHTESGLIGYTGDTQYFDGIAEQFSGSRILIANTTRPLSMRIPWHLCSDDLIYILKEVKPELAVMIHMGMLFLKHPPNKEASRIKSETGVETIPGFSGLRVKIDGGLKVTRPLKQPILEEFSKPGETIAAE